MEQVGNAVPPLMAAAVGRSVKEHLKDHARWMHLPEQPRRWATSRCVSPQRRRQKTSFPSASGSLLPLPSRTNAHPSVVDKLTKVLHPPLETAGTTPPSTKARQSRVFPLHRKREGRIMRLN